MNTTAIILRASHESHWPPRRPVVVAAKLRAPRCARVALVARHQSRVDRRRCAAPGAILATLTGRAGEHPGAGDRAAEGSGLSPRGVAVDAAVLSLEMLAGLRVRAEHAAAAGEPTFAVPELEPVAAAVARD